MLQQCFQNVIILGSIISICIFPFLIYLVKFKNKYNITHIQKIFFIIGIVMFFPILKLGIKEINLINFRNDIKTVSEPIMEEKDTNEIRKYFFKCRNNKYRNKIK